MIEKTTLEKHYVVDKISMKDIATLLGCSENKVVYWMNKHKIRRRPISEAIYQKHNPFGDPFSVKPITTKEDAELFGLGIGLYWGEGNKANKYSVRIGNTDPEMIKMFMRFLIQLYGVQKQDLRFSLQIFSDTDPELALAHWASRLDVLQSQFYRPTITISGSIGTYRKKNEYGVATLYYHNKKLRDIIVGILPS